MSLVRPAGESDFESSDEDEIFTELYDQSSTHRNVKDNKTTTVLEISNINESKSFSGAALKPYSPMVLRDMQTAISTGNVATVEQLLEKVDSPNVLLNSGWPLIVHAAYFCHHSIVQLLIKHGADVSAVNDTGDTALHAACKSGVDPSSESVIKTIAELISCGANVDAKDYNGRTPLMYACRRNLTNAVAYLLDSESPHQRIFSKDDKDWNCIDWCAIFGNIECLKIIINTLQIKIDPKKFMSSKLWPNHVFDFFQTSNQACNVKPTQTNNDHGKTESGIGTYSAKVADQNSASIISDARKSSNEDIPIGHNMKVNELDHEQTQHSCKNQMLPTNENIGDMYRVNKDIDIDKASNDVEMTAVGETSDFTGELFKSSVQGRSQIEGIEDEEYVMPAVIKRDTKRVEEYLTYGHLELFLAGLELSHLIPLFQKQDIKFQELLCLSMDELEKIGIKAYGTRKRIFSAIQDCHEKHTSTSLLPDYTKSPLTTDTMFQMMDGSSEQIEYIASCMRYIKYHIGMYPDTLYPDADKSYEKAPLQLHQEKIDGVTRSLVNLAKSLDNLKSQAEDFEHATAPELTQPVGLATLDNLKDDEQRAKMKRLFAISIAVLAFYIWRKASLYS